MTEPKISVIIPVYNVEKYLKQCLDSVQEQTFSDFEVICIDDCSTDGSYEILEEYARKDPRIRVLRNSVNLKAAGARNVGLDNAEGEYIYFIDADDYIDSGYLEEMWGKACVSGADIVIDLNVRTLTNGQENEYVHPFMPDIPEGGCFMNNKDAIDLSLCVVWMRLFRRKLLEDNHIRFYPLDVSEDAVFHYITGVYASSIFAFRGVSAYHYIIRNDSSVGFVKSGNMWDYWSMKACDCVYDYLRDNGLLDINDARLFNVSAFFKVDTEEKFSLYKSYFRKIEKFLNDHRYMYNEMNLFFADSILSSESLEDYRSRYPESVAIAYVKSRNRKPR